MINISINYKNQLSENLECTESNLLAVPGNPDHLWLLGSQESQASHCSPALLWPLSDLGVLVALLDLVNLQTRRDYLVAKFIQSSTCWRTSCLSLQMGRIKIIIVITFQEKKENLLHWCPYDSQFHHLSACGWQKILESFLYVQNRWYVLRYENGRDILQLFSTLLLKL